MIVCNRFIEVCKDFSGTPLPADQPLHKFVASNLIEPTVDLFKQDQLEQLKNLLLVEDWTRLPLPDGYEIKQLADPLYPFSSSVNFFLQAFDKPDLNPFGSSNAEESKGRSSSSILHEGTGSSVHR